MLDVKRASQIWLGATIASLVGCSTFTGDGDSQGGDDDGQSVYATTGAASTGSNGVGGASNTTGSGGQNLPQTVEQGAVGVEVTGIRLYQGPERILIKERQVTHTIVPLIPGRRAMVSIFYRTNAAYNGAPVTARLTLGSSVVEQTVTLATTSITGNFDTSINFLTDGAQLVPTNELRVDVVQQVEPGLELENPLARYPAVTSPSLTLPYAAGHPIKVVMVPIAWGTDGSNRLPDTSPAHIDVYRKDLMAHFPVSEAAITVRSAVVFNGPLVTADHWSDFLDALADLREADGAPADTFYYGLFNPADTLQAFCDAGCLYGGLGFRASGQDPGSHAAIGLGFPGREDTMTHELGHNHGRRHVDGDCGESGTDPDYPVTNGFIESVTYNISENEIALSTTHKDFMSYCNPVSVGAYGFRTLYDRITMVAATDFVTPAHLINRRWARLNIRPSGAVQWRPSVQLRRPPYGEPLSIEVEKDGQTQTVQGHFRPLDHAAGGTLFVLDDQVPTFSHVRTSLNGVAVVADGRTPVTSAPTLMPMR